MIVLNTFSRLYQRDRRTKTPICHTDNVGEHNIYGDEERNFIRMGGVNCR